MVIHIPKSYSRAELLDLLSPPNEQQRIDRFRAKLNLTEEELLRRQVQGNEIRKMMLALSDFIKKARSISGYH